MIQYYLPQAGHVLLRIHNLMGEEVDTVIDDIQEAGSHRVLWYGTNHFKEPLPSGIYYYTLRNGEFRTTRKMILLR